MGPLLYGSTEPWGTLIYLYRLWSIRRMREGSARSSGCLQESLSTGAQPGFERSELELTGKRDVTHRHRRLHRPGWYLQLESAAWISCHRQTGRMSATYLNRQTDSSDIMAETEKYKNIFRKWQLPLHHQILLESHPKQGQDPT